jgi:hypothetical protein
MTLNPNPSQNGQLFELSNSLEEGSQDDIAFDKKNEDDRVDKVNNLLQKTSSV